MADDDRPLVRPSVPVDTASSDGGVPERSDLSHRLLVVGVVLVVLLGAFLRIWALGREPVNADEAIVGLMAHEILHGHFSAFYWGQQYGGAEPYAVALVFLVAGQSGFTLGLTSVLLAGVAAILVWRIGRRLLSPALGVAAGCVAWVWPEVFVWQSTLEYGFRFVVLVAGLSGVLLLLGLLDTASPPRHPLWNGAGIGVAFGVGWWASPEIAYFALPAVVLAAVALIGRRITLTPRVALVTAGAFLLGALPWIVANISSGGASFRSGPQPDPRFTSHLETLRLHVLPIILGLAVPVSGRFILPHELGRLLEYLLVLGGIALCALLLYERRAPVLVLLALTFPIVYAISPFTWYWQDGRYAIYLVPTAALLGVYGVDTVATALTSRTQRGRIRAVPEATNRAHSAALAGLVVLLVAVTVVGARDVAPFRPGSPSGPAATWTSWHANATGYASTLAVGLEAAGVRGVIAGYWVAEPVTFASRGAVTASDVRYDRDPRLLAEVERDRPAYLFVRPAALAGASAVVGSSLLDPGCAAATDRCLTPEIFSAYLRRRGIAARTVDLGAFEVIVPARYVDPPTIFRAAGIPT